MGFDYRSAPAVTGTRLPDEDDDEVDETATDELEDDEVDEADKVALSEPGEPIA